jgi:tripartite-type tricarboxylate transporter receptor subunit TctC
MRLPRRQFRRLSRAVALLVISIIFNSVVNLAASAQEARTIKVVVPFPPGGAMDVLGRVLAEEIGRAHGPTMVIENRPGAGTVIATELVSRAPPDGNTLLMPANSFVINPFLHKLNYDPLTSFEPICYLVRSPTVIVVNSSSSYHTLADLLDAARTKPGELTMAAVGPATSFHVAIEVFKHEAHVDIGYIPYPGGAPAVTALLGGHVTSVFANYIEVSEHLRSGKLRALATGSPTRLEMLPDLPTIAESGYKDFRLENWLSVVAPAKTPQKTIAQLIEFYKAALQAPQVEAKLASQALLPVALCGKDFGDFIHAQYDEYERVIPALNIKGE